MSIVKIPHELYDWIAPGEIRYCSCGVHLIDPENPKPCGVCQNRLHIEDFACGACGAPSAMMFVHGYRCHQHAFQVEPSQMFGNDKIVGTVGRALKPPAKNDYTAETVALHNSKAEPIIEAATTRKNSGVPAKFWLQAKPVKA